MNKRIMEMYVSVAQKVYYAMIDGEAVVVVPYKSNICSLGAVGSRIWELADGSLKVKKIVKIISEEFKTDENTSGRDVTEFISDLSKKHLFGLSRYKRK